MLLSVTARALAHTGTYPSASSVLVLPNASSLELINTSTRSSASP
jgi:hypothetical protein